MTKTFQIGDKFWIATTGRREVQRPCPVCDGNLFVTLILGSGERVEMPCDYCGKGFGHPKGYITEHEDYAAAEQAKVTRIDSYDNGGGVQYEYYSLISGQHGASCSYRNPKPDEMFDNEGEAQAKAEQMAEAANAARLERDLRAKGDKSYSWYAGYHLREAEHYRSQSEYHERMAAIAKERAS